MSLMKQVDYTNVALDSKEVASWQSSMHMQLFPVLVEE